MLGDNALIENALHNNEYLRLILRDPTHSNGLGQVNFLR